GFTSDYNVVKPFFRIDGATIDLAQWRLTTVGDAHSIDAGVTADLFVSVGGEDYHPSALSRAVDAGSPDRAPPTDIEGTARPQGGAVDAGAFEQVIPPPNNFFDFASAAYTVGENGGAVTITIVRSGDLSNAASVRYSTAPGTATAADYTVIAPTTLVFQAGEASKTVAVAITNDAEQEDNESFT